MLLSAIFSKFTATAVHWRHVAYALPVTGFHTSTFLPPFLGVALLSTLFADIIAATVL